MFLKTVTSAADLPFGGVEIVKTDKNITEVIIGGKLRIRKGESYHAALQVLVESPGEKAERVKVSATIDGFPASVSYFEDDYSAKRAAEDFEAKGAKVNVDKVSVLLNALGEVSEECSAEEKAVEPEYPF